MDKKLGTEIAMGRAEAVNAKMRLPKHGRKDDEDYYFIGHMDNIEHFLERCRSYFQDKPIILPNIEWF